MIHCERLVLERIRLNSRHVLPRNVIDNVGVNVTNLIHHAADGLCVSLATYIAGMVDERIKIDIKYPKDWWQALKEVTYHNFKVMKWAERRWPVEYKHIDIDTKTYKAVCPHIDISGPPNHGPEVHFNWIKAVTIHPDHGRKSCHICGACTCPDCLEARE